MKYYEAEELWPQDAQPQLEEEQYCDFCWDRKKKRDKELFFLDKANNLRICSFCPNCGRAYTSEA